VVKSIDIVVLDKSIKVAKMLKVLVKDREELSGWKKKDSPKQTDPSRWHFKDFLSLYPHDSLTIQPLRSNFGLSGKQIDSYTIPAKDIILFCCREPNAPPDGLKYRIPPGDNSEITLKVSLEGFDEALVKVDTTSLNSNAETDILESLSSSESLRDCASELGSVFDKIGANVEVVEHVIQVLENVASAHPIAKVAVSALLIPFKLLEAEHEFKHDLHSLANRMGFLLKLLADAGGIAIIASTKYTIVKIMKAVIDASHYINEFVNKRRISMFLKYPCSQ